jgi:putative FmdB family regulatory protein
VPTYDYQCRSCGVITEVVHSMLVDGPSECERCGGQLRPVVHASGIIFKGSGFYKTDSRPSSPTAAATADSKPASPSGDGAAPSAPADGGSTGTGTAAPSSGGEGGGAPSA